MIDIMIDWLASHPWAPCFFFGAVFAILCWDALRNGKKETLTPKERLRAAHRAQLAKLIAQRQACPHPNVHETIRGSLRCTVCGDEE